MAGLEKLEEVTAAIPDLLNRQKRYALGIGNRASEVNFFPAVMVKCVRELDIAGSCSTELLKLGNLVQ